MGKTLPPLKSMGVFIDLIEARISSYVLKLQNKHCSLQQGFKVYTIKHTMQLTCNEITTISHSSSQSCAIEDMVTTVATKVTISPI